MMSSAFSEISTPAVHVVRHGLEEPMVDPLSWVQEKKLKLVGICDLSGPGPDRSNPLQWVLRLRGTWTWTFAAVL